MCNGVKSDGLAMWDPRAEGHIVTHVYVALERDKDGYPPFDTEEIDASSLGGARYRIEGIPVFVSGLAKGDIVKVVVTRGDGRRWVTEVLEPSGHLTARVMPWQADALGEVAARFKSLDCPAHATPYGLVAVDVPPSASTERVMRALEKGRATGEWDFDMGVAPGAY